MDPFTKAINKLRSDCKIIDNPSFEELREFAKHDETTTEYGSPSYVTKIRSRSAKFTEIVEDEPTAKQLKAIYDIGEYLKGKELICLDRTMCKEEHHKIGCRIYVPKEYSKIAYLWGKMLFDPIKGKKPDITVVSVPDWKERYVIVDPKSHTTFIFGSDYAGEVKKANLRLAMYIIKEKEDGLGLHAGSKLLRVYN